MMTTPFDFVYLVARLKERGLNLLEDELKIVVDEVFDFVDKSVALTSTPFDDVVRVVLPPLKAAVLPLVDKIDGKVG